MCRVYKTKEWADTVDDQCSIWALAEAYERKTILKKRLPVVMQCWSVDLSIELLEDSCC